MDYVLLEKRIENLESLCKQLAEAIQNIPYDFYSDALRDGCDANGAWDCFCEAMKNWEVTALEAAKKAKVIDG